MKNLILLIGALIMLFSCTTPKKIAYKENDFQIFFGNYGGFTNARMEYVLNGDRNIFKIQKDSIFFIKKTTKNELNEIQKRLTELDFGGLKMNKPGNMTYFIKVISNDYKNQANWSDSENRLLTQLYLQLITTIKLEQ